MSKVFVIQNQQGQFLSRKKEWLSKTEINAFYKTPHRDLAINELVEISSKDTEARARVVAAEASSKGLPLVADLPPLKFPTFELPADLAGAEHAATGQTQSAPPMQQKQLKLQPACAAVATGDEAARPDLEPTIEQV